MKEYIKEKSSYCLNCKIKPCSNKGCPLANNIPEFIKAVKEDDIEKAYGILSETTVLQAICGRICPHKKQCQGSCVRGIKGNPVSIGDLESFVGDYSIEHKLNIEKQTKENLKNKNVAIIGGGPAGLTCAAFLARKGVNVTIYEKYDYLGGLLIHGIPEFRLPKDIVENTINKILDLGVKVEYNKELGKNLRLEELEKYDRIFLSFGANVSSKMNIEGENLEGVYGGNELLEYKNHPDYENKVVLVNGGGNVAMDTARTIKKLGAKKVIVVYRRAREQMPAEDKEVEEAQKEGIEFLFQNNILKIIGKEKIEKVQLIRTELVQKEEGKRPEPVNIEGSEYELNADYLVMALGSMPQEFVKNLGLQLTKWNNIKIDENGRTSNPKIYAGGDLAGCKGTVAWAARSGRNAAEAILSEL